MSILALTVIVMSPYIIYGTLVENCAYYGPGIPLNRCYTVDASFYSSGDLSTGYFCPENNNGSSYIEMKEFPNTQCSGDPTFVYPISCQADNPSWNGTVDTTYCNCNGTVDACSTITSNTTSCSNGTYYSRTLVTDLCMPSSSYNWAYKCVNGNPVIRHFNSSDCVGYFEETPYNDTTCNDQSDCDGVLCYNYVNIDCVAVTTSIPTTTTQSTTSELTTSVSTTFESTICGDNKNSGPGQEIQCTSNEDCCEGFSCRTKDGPKKGKCGRDKKKKKKGKHQKKGDSSTHSKSKSEKKNSSSFDKKSMKKNKKRSDSSDESFENDNAVVNDRRDISSSTFDNKVRNNISWIILVVVASIIFCVMCLILICYKRLCKKQKIDKYKYDTVEIV